MCHIFKFAMPICVLLNRIISPNRYPFGEVPEVFPIFRYVPERRLSGLREVYDFAIIEINDRKRREMGTVDYIEKLRSNL